MELDNGLLMGPLAFKDGLETARTIVQEIHRLVAGKIGYAEAGSYVPNAAKEAYDFAQRAGVHVLGGR